MTYICRYCDYKFSLEDLEMWYREDIVCPKCLDTNLKEVPDSLDNADIFGYNHRKETEEG